MSGDGEPVVVASGLRKSFVGSGRTVVALDAASLTVGPGVVTGLIGPDAAGKTTFMRLACGLMLPDSGELRVLGHDVQRAPASVQAAVGYMPQRFGLYEDLSVQENMALYADLQNVDPAERGARFDELLKMTGLGPFSARLAGQLSGGMKQKLGLACTLVRAPRLLLLDEPTVGVDPVSRRELWSIVYRLVREQGMSVLLSTAYLDEAERCAQVILLHQGAVIGTGSPDEFSAPMKGRTFRVAVPETERRRIQAQLSAQPDVLDATLQGDGVRLVSRKDAPPAIAGLGLPIGDLEPVEPRFEDAFVARLLQDQPAGSAKGAASPAPAARAGEADGEAIVVDDVSRRFGDFLAVKDLKFTVGSGEVFGLLGANGAGKTTTFRMLCGLLPASSGRLRVAGVDLRDAPAAARARIGYMSQKFSLYADLTVAQNLTFFSRVYGLSGRHRAARLDWALEEMELHDYAAVQSSDLPLGYKQRLALACALLHEPDILFLDEPTSGVDPLARREFWARINALAEARVTVLVTTHFMEEAEYCDRLAIMAAGEILTIGTPREIKAGAGQDGQPAETLEAAFLALVEKTAVAA